MIGERKRRYKKKISLPSSVSLLFFWFRLPSYKKGEETGKHCSQSRSCAESLHIKIYFSKTVTEHSLWIWHRWACQGAPESWATLSTASKVAAVSWQASVFSARGLCRNSSIGEHLGAMLGALDRPDAYWGLTQGVSAVCSWGYVLGLVGKRERRKR